MSFTLVDLIGSSVILEPTGEPTGTLRGTCPWCGARRLLVHPTRELWQCFGCARGGDAEGWLRRFVKGQR